LKASAEQSAVNDALADCAKRDRNCQIIAVGPFSVGPNQRSIGRAGRLTACGGQVAMSPGPSLEPARLSLPGRCGWIYRRRSPAYGEQHEQRAVSLIARSRAAAFSSAHQQYAASVMHQPFPAAAAFDDSHFIHVETNIGRCQHSKASTSAAATQRPALWDTT